MPPLQADDTTRPAVRWRIRLLMAMSAGALVISCRLTRLAFWLHSRAVAEVGRRAAREAHE